MNKLCLLDTNIISDTLKENQSIEQKIIDKRNQGYELCIHLLSLAELKKSEYLIDKFCELTKTILFHIIKPSHQLLEVEKINYPGLINKSQIILMSLQAEKKAELIAQHNYLKSEQFKTDASYLREGQLKAADNLKSNLRSERKNNRLEYVDRYVWTQLSISDPHFFKSIIDANNVNSLICLKSLFVQAHFNYYKYIEKDQLVEMNDSYDTLIISCLPYIDLFLTERKNGGLLKELKRKLDIIANLEIETMRDLRSK